jgi:hypothetical protein
MKRVLTVQLVYEDEDVVNTNGQNEERNDFGDDKGDAYAQEGEKPDGRRNSDQDDGDPEQP